MTKMIEQTGAWIAEQVRRQQFAEITIKIVIHEGEVRQVERGVIEKIRPDK